MSSTKATTVEEASPSPPPLPNEPLPQTADEPIATLGEDTDDEDGSIEGGGSDEDEKDEEEWDPAADRPPTSTSKGKGKAKEGSATAEGAGSTSGSGEADAQPWQAVWSAEQNAWYFWNTTSGEVTWTNPLVPPSVEADAPPLPTEAPPLPTEQPPLPNEEPPPMTGPPDIDPGLHYLLPPEQRGMGLSKAEAGAQTALFNARTGRFTANNYQYTVGHLDEYNRANRMKSHYFDVDSWEKERAEENAKRKRDEEMGIAPKAKISRKDMERFKAKKAERKARSQAWLRD